MNSREDFVVTKAIERLFELWNTPAKLRAVLIDSDDSCENQKRIGCLLSIHKSLKLLYPENPELIYGWINMHNKHFGDRTPLEVMCEKGFDGMRTVVSYLELCLRK